MKYTKIAKPFFLFLMTLQLSVVSFSQNNNQSLDSLLKLEKKVVRERDSFIRMDLLERHYNYLDKNFKIDIDSVTFNRIASSEKFKTESYKDSLMVILAYELKSDAGAGIAFHRILYKWEKVGFYIWKTEEQAKALGTSLGFNHPYRFYEYLMDEAISTQKKLNIFKEVKLKLEEKHKNKSYNIKPYKNFLNEAFKLNPDRIKAMEDYIKENSKHKH